MKFYINFVFLVSIFNHVRAIDVEDIYMFLPSLRNYEPPPACPANELYKTCMGKCSDCTKRGMCAVTTCVKGCDCAPRFYRVTPDGPCEPVANCPKPVCGENEAFRACGPICERCTTIKCRVINCDYKCYCKEGYSRNREGVCIASEECPKKQHCSHNEEWAESGPVDEFCFHGSNQTDRNETQNVPRCYCKEGYKRNTIGHCISINLCPLIRCLGVEVYHNCIPKCNTTCRNYGDLNCTEDDNCYQGCFCPPGYVMNDFRSCIPVENCSLDITQVKILVLPAPTEDDASSDSESTTESSSEQNKDTTDTTEYSRSNSTSEDDLKDSEEKETSTSIPPDPSDAGTTENPVSSSLSIVKDPKGKDSGKMKTSNERSPKHANAAASSEASKKEVPKNEEDFDNEEI